MECGNSRSDLEQLSERNAFAFRSGTLKALSGDDEKGPLRQIQGVDRVLFFVVEKREYINIRLSLSLQSIAVGLGIPCPRWRDRKGNLGIVSLVPRLQIGRGFHFQLEARGCL